VKLRIGHFSVICQITETILRCCLFFHEIKDRTSFFHQITGKIVNNYFLVKTSVKSRI
jgi:hypothetical protein